MTLHAKLQVVSSLYVLILIDEYIRKYNRIKYLRLFYSDEFLIELDVSLC